MPTREPGPVLRLRRCDRGNSKSVCTLYETCSRAAGITCTCSCLGRGHGSARLQAALSVQPEKRAEARAWTRTELGVGAAGSKDAYSPRRVPKSGPDDNPLIRKLARIRHERGVDEALGVAVNTAIDVFDQLAAAAAVAD
jgi:hypothetical protein